MAKKPKSALSKVTRKSFWWMLRHTLGALFKLAIASALAIAAGLAPEWAKKTIDDWERGAENPRLEIATDITERSITDGRGKLMRQLLPESVAAAAEADGNIDKLFEGIHDDQLRHMIALAMQLNGYEENQEISRNFKIAFWAVLASNDQNINTLLERTHTLMTRSYRIYKGYDASDADQMRKILERARANRAAYREMLSGQDEWSTFVIAAREAKHLVESAPNDKIVPQKVAQKIADETYWYEQGKSLLPPVAFAVNFASDNVHSRDKVSLSKALILEQILFESGAIANKVSPSGCTGLYQFCGPTWRAMLRLYGAPLAKIFEAHGMSREASELSGILDKLRWDNKNKSNKYAKEVDGYRTNSLVNACMGARLALLNIGRTEKALPSDPRAADLLGDPAFIETENVTGAGGGIDIIKSGSGTSVGKVLPEGTVKPNQHLLGDGHTLADAMKIINSLSLTEAEAEAVLSFALKDHMREIKKTPHKHSPAGKHGASGRFHAAPNQHAGDGPMRHDRFYAWRARHVVQVPRS